MKMFEYIKVWLQEVTKENVPMTEEAVPHVNIRYHHMVKFHHANLMVVLNMKKMLNENDCSALEWILASCRSINWQKYPFNVEL
jgi:hypothetical protein